MITAQLVKELRERTGISMMDCKSALVEANGDIEKSIEFLRKKGIAKASKKMSRTASEGLVLVKENNGEVSLIEINSETDFVAKNKDFISFSKELSEINFAVKGNHLGKTTIIGKILTTIIVIICLGYLIYLLVLFSVPLTLKLKDCCFS